MEAEKMNLQPLFTMQKSLDTYIQSEKNVSHDVFFEKGLALLVELAELANETRCFKFWSEKGPSKKEVILEEYVDSIHFLLSLGIEKKLDNLDVWPTQSKQDSLTYLFLHTQTAIHQFLKDPTMSTYKEVWVWYGAIANNQGFTQDGIIQAYLDKNEKNYERQRTGY